MDCGLLTPRRAFFFSYFILFFRSSFLFSFFSFSAFFSGFSASGFFSTSFFFWGFFYFFFPGFSFMFFLGIFLPSCGVFRGIFPCFFLVYFLFCCDCTLCFFVHNLRCDLSPDNVATKEMPHINDVPVCACMVLHVYVCMHACMHTQFRREQVISLRRMQMRVKVFLRRSLLSVYDHEEGESTAENTG